jgi:sensor histidine kinase YesM
MNDNVYITVTNPVIGNIDIENMQTQKQNSASHGFGIISMRTIAEKYDGEIIFECENGVFRVTITLRNGQSND